MEEINFNPKIKIEISYFLISIIIFIITIFILNLFNFNFFESIYYVLIISFSIIVTIISTLIKKLFTKYSITDNEIELFYQFISKESKVYRIDQITSIELSRSFLEKIFGLGTISFGIFGSSNSNQNNKSALINHSFRTISNYNEIFEFLKNSLNLKNSQIIFKEKPSTKPTFTLFIISILLFLLYLIFSNLLFIEFYFIKILLLIFLLIFSILSLFIFLEMKNSIFTIGNSYIDKKFDYFFQSKNVIVPIEKITNSNIKKNLILYWLFKVGSVKLFTGGDKDPNFNSLNKFEVFFEHLGSLLKKKYSKNNYNNTNNQNKINNLNHDNNLNLVKNSFSNKNNSVSKNFLITTPGTSFIITFIFWWSILISILILILNFIFNLNSSYQMKSLIFTILFSIYFIGIILRFILWKNTKYEFYSDRIVDISGIINIERKEIFFKNIKHINLSKNLFFDRILNQGTIHIFTPGTIYIDNKINSIHEYENIYKEIKEKIL